MQCFPRAQSLRTRSHRRVRPHCHECEYSCNVCPDTKTETVFEEANWQQLSVALAARSQTEMPCTRASRLVVAICRIATPPHGAGSRRRQQGLAAAAPGAKMVAARRFPADGAVAPAL